MAFILVSTSPSRPLYDAVDRLVDLSGDRPGGMILHAAAEQADGTILIVDAWESEEAMDAFERSRLLPAFATMPGAPMPEPPTRHSVFHLVRA
jgi:quinol monooxygenase YgiN